MDKNLRQHGLIQAFSRTNRILNSVKTFGNIVCFRDLQREVDDAIALFGDKDAHSIVILKDYNAYYFGFTDEKGMYHPGYIDLVKKLLDTYPLEEEIVGEQAQRAFVYLFSSLLRMRNLLSSFDAFKEGQNALPPLHFQDYTSRYLDIKDRIRPARGRSRRSPCCPRCVPRR